VPELPQNQASSLQDPRLSPLHNRLLAENLGRWAHIYYTTPPEERERALTALLNELTASAPASVGKNETAAAAHTLRETLPAPATREAPKPAAPPFEGRPQVPVAAPVSRKKHRHIAVTLGCFLAAGVVIFAWRQSSVPATPAEGGGAAPNISSSPSPPATAEGTRRALTNDVPPSERRIVPSHTAPPAPQKAAAPSRAIAVPAKTTPTPAHQAATLSATTATKTEDVQKLWQDVKQRKPEALVSLAGIYARGDGVARDCGQATVLTEAAIRRAPQRAAELRQSLQQAGCE
jgi:hypothetical protein